MQLPTPLSQILQRKLIVSTTVMTYTVSYPDVEEVRPRVRQAVQEFIKEVAEDIKSRGYITPTSEVIIKECPLPEPECVPTPRGLITLYSSRQDEFFGDIAEWLVLSGNGFPEPDRPDDDVPTTVIGNPDKLSSDQEQRLFRHQNAVFNLAGDVLNYVGAIEFKQEAFEAAFEQEFLPRYETDLEGYKVVIPLLNVISPEEIDNSMELFLESGFEIHHRGTYHRVESLVLTRLDHATANALRTFEYNYRQSNQSELINPDQLALRAEIKSSVNKELPREMTDAPGKQLGKRFVTALRLFAPTAGPVGFQRAFEITSGWKTYRFGLPEVIDTDEGGREPAFERDAYELPSSDWKQFQNLWSELAHQIRLDPRYELSTALRRFNEMYVKPYPGDRLLDCMIACEGLLLRGSHPGTKTSRMSLRASLLLDEFADLDRADTRDRIKTAYKRRGKLVHQDRYLTGILNPQGERDSSSFLHPEEYLTDLRALLADVILAYLETTRNGYSVSEVNEAIDTAVRDAPFNVDKP